MKLLSIILCIYILFATINCIAADEMPNVTSTSDFITVRVKDQNISLSLTNGTLTYQTLQGSWNISGSFLSDKGEGWDPLSSADGKPVIKKGKDYVTASAVFPITDKRKLTVELSAYKGIPAVFVVTRLTRLDCTRGEYYFWQTGINFNSFISPGFTGDEETKVDPKDWQAYDNKDWMLLRSNGTSTVMVMPGAKTGRSPGENGSLYFHAVPASYNVSPGGYQNCSFGLANASSVAEAREIYSQAVERKVPALGFIPGVEKPAYGDKSPGWLQKAENYTLYYQPAATWTDELFNSKLKYYPLIVGSTPDKKALNMCHKAGIKLLVYVNYMELLDTERLIKGGREVYYEWSESIDHDSRDLKNHPDWFCRDNSGNIMRSAFAVNTNNPGLHYTCFHQKGLQEAAIKQIKLIMEAGYDGVFIDNAMSVPDCYGDKFSKHKHTPGMSNTKMYEELQKKIYTTVKSFGNDRIVMQNGMLPSHWSYCDSWMAESMPFNTGKMSNDWSELRWMGIEHKGAQEHGKVPVILPYLAEMPTDKLKDSALFSMAYGRLYGFLWTDCMALLDRPETSEFGRELCSMKLGNPVGDIEQPKRILFREFKHGFAFLNPTKIPVTITIPDNTRSTYKNVGFNETIEAKTKKLTITIPPESGRALLRI